MRTKTFTGYHATGILVAFFGVVITVNFTMATLATRTFGGTIVDNSYVASQKFNGWLSEARNEQRLGWSTRLGLDAQRRVTIEVAQNGVPLPGVTGRATVRHPLGQAPETTLVLRSDGKGRLISDRALPAGRWIVHVDLLRGQDRKRLIESLA